MTGVAQWDRARISPTRTCSSEDALVYAVTGGLARSDTVQALVAAQPCSLLTYAQPIGQARIDWPASVALGDLASQDHRES